jgi:hypothetical protein
MGVFGQVLESDGVNVDDAMVRGERMGDVHAFSKGTVRDCVKQIESTVEKLDVAS